MLHQQHKWLCYSKGHSEDHAWQVVKATVIKVYIVQGVLLTVVVRVHHGEGADTFSRRRSCREDGQMPLQ